MTYSNFGLKTCFLNSLILAHNSYIYNTRKIHLTWHNSILGSISISEGIDLAKKETNFGERDVCGINCIENLKLF